MPPGKRYSEKTANRPKGARHDHARDFAMPLARSGAPIQRDRDLSPDLPDDTRVRSYIRPDKNLNPFSERHPAGEKISKPNPPPPQMLSKPARPFVASPKPRLHTPPLPPKRPVPQHTKPVHTGMYKNINRVSIGPYNNHKQRIAHEDKRRNSLPVLNAPAADKMGQTRGSLSELPTDAPALITKKTDTSGPYRVSDGENHPDPIPPKKQRAQSPGVNSSRKSSAATLICSFSNEKPVKKEQAAQEKGAVDSAAKKRPAEERTQGAKGHTDQLGMAKAVKEEPEDVKPAKPKKEEPMDEGYLRAEGKVPESSRNSTEHRTEMDQKLKDQLVFFQNVAEKGPHWCAVRLNKRKNLHYQPTSRSNSPSIQKQLGKMRRDLLFGRPLVKTPLAVPPSTPASTAAPLPEIKKPDKITSTPQHPTISTSNSAPVASAASSTRPVSTFHKESGNNEVVGTSQAAPTPIAGSAAKAVDGSQQAAATKIVRKPILVPPPLPGKHRIHPVKTGGSCNKDTSSRSVPASGTESTDKPHKRLPASSSSFVLSAPADKVAPEPDSDDDIVFIGEVPAKKTERSEKKRH